MKIYIIFSRKLLKISMIFSRNHIQWRNQIQWRKLDIKVRCPKGVCVSIFIIWIWPMILFLSLSQESIICSDIPYPTSSRKDSNFYLYLRIEGLKTTTGNNFLGFQSIYPDFTPNKKIVLPKIIENIIDRYFHPNK